MTLNIISGNDSSNTLAGGGGDDLIYGFDPNAAYPSASITATRVASGLNQPLFAAAPPGDTGRLFIVEKTGAIKILDLNTGSVLSTPFLTAPVVSAGERGLLGLAFDPDFASNGFFYIYSTVTAPATHNVVERYQVSGNPNVANAASRQTVINLDNLSGATNHNGGWIGFGPDNNLYIATGDNANGANAQTLSNLLGKILRIDVEGGLPYQIPPDNPFVGTPGARPEIFALGLRNPWRASFDSASGKLFIGDVGEATIEEINLGQKGANYGWPNSEGPSGNPALTNPIAFYNHSVGQSITGGYVYNGESDGLNGQYFYADFSQHKLFTLRFDGTSWITTERTAQVQTNIGTINNPSSFGEDGRGNLYLVDVDGEIYRLTPTVASSDLGDTLSAGAGNDRLFGGAGPDSLDGGIGADFLNGGLGDDRFTYRPGYGADVIFAFAAGPNTEDKVDVTAFLSVGTFADVLARATQVGSDTVINFGGGDTLTLRNVTRSSLTADDFITATDVGGPGINWVGTPEGDIFFGTNGADVLDGRDGGDILTGESGNDIIFAGTGDDTATGGAGSDTILGQDGNDTLSGDTGDDRINGGLGGDVIFGGTGNDELGGATGNDTLVGQEGADAIFGEDGNDTANGGPGNDIMVGGIGNDTFGGGSENDVLVGGDGDDLLFGEEGTDSINGEFGNDGVIGGASDDLLGGGPGDDIVVGDDGNDVLFGETGNDAMNGGFGNDTLLGSDGDDQLGGGAGDDDVNGGFGNDTIFGENGSDILNGSAGNDVLIGGGNDDTFAFSVNDGADTIGDFFAGGPEDRIWFIGTSLHSFADVQANAVTNGGNTTITYNGFFTVTLNGVTIAQLTAGDFIFT